MSAPELNLELIQAAHQRIQSKVLRTPTISHQTASGSKFYCKAESLQSIGAFKIRGAYNMMASLPEDCPGVVAHSSGNHAQAVARAAKWLGLKAVIVMPDNAPELKRARTEADGAEIVVVGPDSNERAEKAQEIAQARNYVLVPPYDHPLIAAGQGTAAVELHQDAPEFSRFYCPASGGGLLSGCAAALAALRPDVELVAVEPAVGNDWALSLAAGKRISVPPPDTIADGLRVRVPGRFTFETVHKLVHRVVLVTDQQLMEAMAYALQHLRVVLEPSGAASLAAALAESPDSAGILLSGGNVAPKLLAEITAASADRPLF